MSSCNIKISAVSQCRILEAVQYMNTAAVAAGSDSLAWEKYATALAILTQFKSQQGFNAL